MLSSGLDEARDHPVGRVLWDLSKQSSKPEMNSCTANRDSMQCLAHLSLWPILPQQAELHCHDRLLLHVSSSEEDALHHHSSFGTMWWVRSLQNGDCNVKLHVLLCCYASWCAAVVDRHVGLCLAFCMSGGVCMSPHTSVHPHTFVCLQYIPHMSVCPIHLYTPPYICIPQHISPYICMPFVHLYTPCMSVPPPYICMTKVIPHVSACPIHLYTLPYICTPPYTYTCIGYNSIWQYQIFAIITVQGQIADFM